MESCMKWQVCTTSIYILQSGNGLEALCYLYNISHGDAAVLTEAFNIETFLCGRLSGLEWHLKSHLGKEQHMIWQGLLHHDRHGRTLSLVNLADELWCDWFFWLSAYHLISRSSCESYDASTTSCTQSDRRTNRKTEPKGPTTVSKPVLSKPVVGLRSPRTISWSCTCTGTRLLCVLSNWL